MSAGRRMGTAASRHGLRALEDRDVGPRVTAAGADTGGTGVAALEQEIALVAASDAGVLLCGETGTGKGVAARAIHARSPRRQAPFVHVDCASLSPGLIESELFGHERGAFTGAQQARIGRMELAADGTLFLDEIAELPTSLQAKLLRVLQDRRFERVGGTRTHRLRARVIAATNCELRAAIAAGRFRADLYYRLAVVELEIPPLRARVAQLPRLVEAGLRDLAARTGRPAPTCAAPALAALAAHAWPGNVRELMNVLERIAVRWPGEHVGADAVRAVLPRPVATVARTGDAGRAGAAPPGGATDPRAARDADLAQAVRRCGGNVARAARLLGIPRSTLRYRLRAGEAAHASAQLDLPLE